MYIYLDLGNSQWVYINLTKTIANVLSSDQKLNEIAAATAEKLPADDYFLKMATQRQVDKFLLRFAD